MKNKFKLEKFKVSSFVTVLENLQQVNGGLENSRSEIDTTGTSSTSGNPKVCVEHTVDTVCQESMFC
ncbi:MAG: hypothetical protein AAFQ94_09860 [Bacteroidota bacterium]